MEREEMKFIFRKKIKIPNVRRNTQKNLQRSN